MPSIQQRLVTSAPPQGAAAAAPSSNTSDIRLVENTCLFLPSDLLKDARDERRPESTDVETIEELAVRAERRDSYKRAMADGLADAELRLRKAQCSDAIEALRTKLFTRTRLIQYKRLNVRNQGPNTRARDALAGVQRKIELIAAKYNAARDALRSLVGKHDVWVIEYDRRYPRLRKEDIRGLEDEATGKARKKKMMRGAVIGEGMRKASWIWRGAASTDSDDMNASECRFY